MTFYSKLDGSVKYNFVHTMNSRGNPDTLTIDPLHTYKIEVHTIPPVSIDSVKLIPGKHTTVGIDAGQGSLTLKLEGLNDYKKLQCVVRRSGKMNTLNVQDFNTTEKYLVGKYDLEIFTLPRIYFFDVDIAQSKTTTFQIPQPGLTSFMSNSPGFGSIYTQDNQGMKWVCNLDENLNKETLVLQPGNYRVVFRAKNARESIYTVDKTFKVASGVSSIVPLN
jgi:Ca-activated chloride channel family protein